jgi:hypothetical protein
MLHCYFHGAGMAARIERRPPRLIAGRRVRETLSLSELPKAGVGKEVRNEIQHNFVRKIPIAIAPCE